MMKYVKSRKIYEGEQKEFKFINENLNEGRKLSRGNYKIEWPLTDKYAEWLPKEIKDVEAIEYDDGEWGGFEISRNWTDKNPIQNFQDDMLAQTPGNLFYNKTKIGSMSITSYNVTSDDHVVAKMKLRIVKVNNGKKDGYIIFYEFDIDSGFDEYEEGTIALDSWARVMKLLKRCRDNMKSEDGFYKVLDSRAQTAVKFLLGESEVFEESLNEASHGKLVDQAATIDAAARNWPAPAQKKWEEECEDLFYDYSGDGDGGTVEVTWDDIEDRDLKEIIKTARQIMKQYGIKESVNEAEEIHPEFFEERNGDVYIKEPGKKGRIWFLGDNPSNYRGKVKKVSKIPRTAKPVKDWESMTDEWNNVLDTISGSFWTLQESVNEAKINDKIQPKLLPFSKVKLGNVGIDYFNKPAYVIGIGKYSELEHFDQAGLADGFENDEDCVAVISLDDWDRGNKGNTAVFTYGDDGFAIYEEEEINEGIKSTINSLFKAIKKRLGMKKMVRVSDDIYLYARDYVEREYGAGHTLSGIGVDAIQDIIYGTTMDVNTGAEEDWEIEIPMDLRESVNEGREIEVTKKMWDKDWSLAGRMSAKEYDEKWDKRFNSLLSIIKDPDDAEKHVEKDWNELPSYAGDMVLYESTVNEGRKRIRVKRKYGENHPEKSVGKYAPVREAILQHVKEKGGTISKDELKEFIKGMNEDRGTKTTWNWVRRNAKYIKETRNGYKITKLGERVLKATSLNESLLLTEGQFSWMTQDTGKQIGSERMNTIFVTMFDDKGNRYEEKGYDGYGEFGGKDYYELLAEMNGINKDNVDELIEKCKVRVFGKDLTSKLRQCGIELAFESNKKLAVEAAKITGTVKLKYPALYEYPNKFNKNRHDFYREAESDPNQSWYVEDEYDDDGYF